MITLDHVSKQYKSSARPALDNISLKIDKGEFVFLIGPSGSGKYTFMRLLLAEDQPSSGDIRVSKFHVNKLSGRHVPGLRQVMGCVFQDFRLLQQKTVFENVAFALEVIGKRADVINRVVPDVLEMVGLSGKANRLPAELSGGEQQPHEGGLARTRRSDEEYELTLVDLDRHVVERGPSRRLVLLGDMVEGDHHGGPV
jgi:cell division transport system ATP-binding protein